MPSSATAPAALPTSSNTNAEIAAFAADNGISLRGATNKAQRLAMIEEAINARP